MTEALGKQCSGGNKEMKLTELARDRGAWEKGGARETCCDLSGENRRGDASKKETGHVWRSSLPQHFREIVPCLLRTILFLSCVYACLAFRGLPLCGTSPPSFHKFVFETPYMYFHALAFSSCWYEDISARVLDQLPTRPPPFLVCKPVYTTPRHATP